VVYDGLCVDGKLVRTFGAGVKDRLAFISRTQLHRVEGHLRVAALRAPLLDRRTMVTTVMLMAVLLVAFLMLFLLDTSKDVLAAVRYEGLVFEN
jgi:hypothetical protein